MILDTTVLVDLLRGDKRTIERIRELESDGELLWIPAPALFELWEGIERADRPERERRRVAEVLAGYTVLGYESKHAERGGSLSGELIRRGEMMDALDAQIAGVALAQASLRGTSSTSSASRA